MIKTGYNKRSKKSDLHLQSFREVSLATKRQQQIDSTMEKIPKTEWYFAL